AEGSMIDIVIDREGTGSEYPTYRIFAPTAEWADTHWILLNGYLNFFPQQDRMMTFAFDTLKQKDLTETPQQLLAEQKDPEEMNYAELGRFIESIQRSGGDARKLEVERMLKIAVPLACLVVVLFGSALGNSTGRAGPAMGVGIALGTVLIYLLIVRVAQGMGAGGVIPPPLAAWLPNFLFLGIGLGLLWRTST
ncbi:MAG: LptF/LptG family permease, partial [Gemmatimonadales bacterium]